MNIKHLDAFVSAVSLGSISAAARHLKKGQPLVSQWIQELELNLGIELFIRTGNKSLANENAYDLLPFALKVLKAENEFQLAAKSIEQGELTHLVIALDQWVPAQPLHKALADFMVAFPKLNIEMQTLNRDDIIEGVKSNVIQLGIISELDDLHHHVNFKRIGFYEDVYVASKNWLAKFNKTPITLDILENERELLLSMSDEQIKENVSPQTFLQVTDFELLLTLLKEGLGFAMLSKQVVKDELSQGSLVIFKVAHESVALERRVEMIWPFAGEKIKELDLLMQKVQSEHGFHH